VEKLYCSITKQNIQYELIGEIKFRKDISQYALDSQTVYKKYIQQPSRSGFEIQLDKQALLKINQDVEIQEIQQGIDNEYYLFPNTLMHAIEDVKNQWEIFSKIILAKLLYEENSDMMEVQTGSTDPSDWVEYIEKMINLRGQTIETSLTKQKN